MSLDPSLLTGFAAGGLMSMLTPKPQMPEFQAPANITMTPNEPPRAPLSPSQTASLQRARQSMAGMAGGNNDFVLTSTKRRSEDVQGGVARTMLLGR